MLETCKRLYSIGLVKLEALKDFPALLFRLILAYGFYEPAIRKISDIGAIGKWFESLGYPFPLLNAYMAACTEITGVVLLTLGLATRLISIPLMFVMIIAITTVHLQNGFSCGDNGFEIPFYYFFMLFALLIWGPGKYSVDTIIKSKLFN